MITAPGVSTHCTQPALCSHRGDTSTRWSSISVPHHTTRRDHSQDPNGHRREHQFAFGLTGHAFGRLLEHRSSRPWLLVVIDTLYRSLVEACARVVWSACIPPSITHAPTNDGVQGRRYLSDLVSKVEETNGETAKNDGKMKPREECTPGGYSSARVRDTDRRRGQSRAFQNDITLTHWRRRLLAPRGREERCAVGGRWKTSSCRFILQDLTVETGTRCDARRNRQ